MSEKEYISVSQYAKAKGISKQAVYKQLNGKLKEFVIVVESKKCLSLSALTEEERQKLTQVEQRVEQQLFNEIQLLLEEQIAEKDKLIQSLLGQVESLQRQNETLTENIQKQNETLTELLRNSQVLLAVEKKEQLVEGKEENKKKRGIFGIFRKRKEENT